MVTTVLIGLRTSTFSTEYCSLLLHVHIHLHSLSYVIGLEHLRDKLILQNKLGIPRVRTILHVYLWSRMALAAVPVMLEPSLLLCMR